MRPGQRPTEQLWNGSRTNRIVEESLLSQLKSYVIRHEDHLDRYMRPMFDPAGKTILVIGSGWGTETYWALKNGAMRIVGIDPAARSTEPLCAALREMSPTLITQFEHHQCTLSDFRTDVEFDSIISNNTFEHIFDLVGTLCECRRFMRKKGQRLHIFADPLYYSSCGSHLPVDAWEHLRVTSEDALKARLTAKANWAQYKTGLNRMTITTFLEAVRSAGMAIEHLSIVPDRNRRQYQALAGSFVMPVMPMDAVLEGISCSLVFPENM